MSTPSTPMACCWTCRASRAICPPKPRPTPAGLAPPDLVLVCVKSADTEAGRPVAGRSPAAGNIRAQPAERRRQRAAAAAVTGHAVIPAVVYVGSEMAGPGHVRHHGGGDLAIGASPASEALAQTLQAAGIGTTIADDIEITLWSKLIINCAFNALSAVAGIAYGPMMRGRRRQGCHRARGAGSRRCRPRQRRRDARRPRRRRS